jgi:hypothetical protein
VKTIPNAAIAEVKCGVSNGSMALVGCCRCSSSGKAATGSNASENTSENCAISLRSFCPNT